MSRNLFFRWQAWAILGLGVAACERSTDQPGSSNEIVEEPVPEPVLPAAPGQLDRRALLLAVADAASAAGLGRDDSAKQRELDGKPFEVRIRFGCPAEAMPARPADGPFRIRFERDTRTLRIGATPDLQLDAGVLASMAGAEVEAVEGFWMYRPWLLADGCPRSAGQAATPLAEESDAKVPSGAAEPPARSGTVQRVGLAQFFTGSDSRTRRRHERPYELTEVLDEREVPSPNGYNLVLSGRLRTPPGGRVISCRPLAALAPPECVVSAQFDRVRIEHPGTGSVLAEWAS